MGPRRDRTESVEAEEWEAAEKTHAVSARNESESSSSRAPQAPRSTPTGDQMRVSLGMLIISVGAPKTQGMIVKFVTTTKGFEAVGIIEAAHRKGRGSGAWMPVTYVEKRLARLPSQEGPPLNVLANVPAMQALLGQWVDSGRELEEEDFEPLIRLAEQVEPPPEGENRGETERLASTSSREVNTSSRNSGNMGGANDQNWRMVSPEPKDVEVEMLTLRVRELKAALRAAHKDNPNWRSETNEDDDDFDQVRSAPYAKLHTPCPFSDDRSTMNPVQRASVNQFTRMQYRLFLGELYAEHRSATEAVAYFFKIFGLDFRYRTSEECCLELHAKILDQFLLDGNAGSWSLWSESGVDLLVKGFLELLVRINPDRTVPLITDQRLNARLKKMSFGHNRTYGPIRPKSTKNNSFNQNSGYNSATYGNNAGRNDYRENRHDKNNRRNDNENFRSVIPVIQQAK